MFSLLIFRLLSLENINIPKIPINQEHSEVNKCNVLFGKTQVHKSEAGMDLKRQVLY
jgi:hypothetical protein